MEHHPALFERAEKIELETGNGPKVRRSNGIHWIAEDWPLSRIRDEAERIFQTRVMAVSAMVLAGRQNDLFEIDEMEESGVSCGLLCGK